MSQTSGQLKSSAHQTGIIVVSIFAAFLPPFMASSLTVALPSIGRHFSMTVVHLSWIINSYFLAIAVFLVPFGRAGDLYGRRNIFLCGTIFFSVASLLAGAAPSVPLLILFRVMQGIGGAMIFGTGMAMLTAAVPPQRRGLMLGANVASTYLGLSLGPFLGGLLTGTFGWRCVFFAPFPLCIIIIVLVLWKIRKERIDAAGESFDFAGSAVYGLALVSCIVGLVNLPHRTGIIAATAGLSGLALFSWIESRRKSPVLQIGLFRHNKVFAFSNLAALLNYSATSGAVFLLSLYLQYVKGLPPRSAGIVLIAQPCVMALCSPFAGKLSDTVEIRFVASSGMALTALGLFYFSTVSAATPVGGIVFGLVLLGLGVAFFSSPNTSAIMGSVEKPFYGMASSIVGTMRLTGGMISMGVVAMILAAFVGNSAITPAKHGAFISGAKISFMIFGLLCALGAAASLFRGNVHRTDGGRTPEPEGDLQVME